MQMFTQLKCWNSSAERYAANFCKLFIVFVALLFNIKRHFKIVAHLPKLQFLPYLDKTLFIYETLLSYMTLNNTAKIYWG